MEKCIHALVVRERNGWRLNMIGSTRAVNKKQQLLIGYFRGMGVKYPHNEVKMLFGTQGEIDQWVKDNAPR